MDTLNSTVEEAARAVQALAAEAGGLACAMAQAASLSMLNAVCAQQSDNILADAAMATVMTALLTRRGDIP